MKIVHADNDNVSGILNKNRMISILFLGGPFSRYGKGSQSTRSTQWEVFRNPGDDAKKRSHDSRSRSSSQRVKKSSKSSTSPFKVG